MNKQQEKKEEQGSGKVNKIYFNLKAEGKKPKAKVGEQTAFKEKCSEKDLKDDDLRQYPYCAIGKIIGSWKGKNIYGTGFLISDNKVMTCAHNIYHHADESIYETFQLSVEQIQLYFYKQGSGLVKHKIEKYFFPEQYKHKQAGLERAEYDYAILDLGENFINERGYFGYYLTPIKEISMNQKCYVAGFQGDNTFMKCAEKNEKTLIKLQEKFVKYQLSTLPGQSGCPAFIQDADEKIYAIGIHIQGSGSQSVQNYNLAKRIDAVILEKAGLFSQLKKENMNNRQLNEQKFNQQLQLKHGEAPYLLTEVEGQHNKLCSIPEFLYKRVSNLFYLNLRQNLITSLPNEIDEMSQLRVLLLSGNRIKKLPKMNKMNIEELDLSRNNFMDQEDQIYQNLWQVIITLESLQKLYLNELGLQFLFKLPENLFELYVAKNKLTELDIQYQDKMKRLVKIDASYNQISKISPISNLQGARIVLIGNKAEDIKQQQAYIQGVDYGQTFILE